MIFSWFHVFCYYLLAYLLEFVLSEHTILVFSRPVWQPAVSGTMSVFIETVSMDVLILSSPVTVLGLDTLSSHVLADCIPNSVPAD